MRNTVGTLEYEDLPRAARAYIEAIEEEVGAPVGIVSTGPRREETIVRREPSLCRLLEGNIGPVVLHRSTGSRES